MAQPPQRNPKPSAAVVNHLQDRVLETTDVRELLDGLVTFSKTTLVDPAVTFCSVILVRQQEAMTAGSSEGRALRLDNGQYQAGDGPCLAAIREQATVHVPDVTKEDRWPVYMAAALREGVGSSLSVPLILEGDTAAGLNLYSTRSHGFSGHDIDMIQEYAFSASKALRLAVRISGLTEENDRLAADLDAPNMTDLATGAVMVQNQCDQATALTILTIAASTRRMDVRDIAPSVLASIPETMPGSASAAEYLSSVGVPFTGRWAIS
jgi:GAF domain-containing protein